MSSENYRVEKQNVVYFLTFTVTDRVDVFTRPNYRIIITDSLDFCRKNKGLKLYAWCFPDSYRETNHMHFVCSIEEPFRMTDFLRDYKKFTAKAVLDEIQNLSESRRDWMLHRFEFAGKFDNRIEKYRFWQDKSHPIELTTTELLHQRINYIHENPVRTGLVASAEEYLYSSARNYAGLSSVIEIDEL